MLEESIIVSLAAGFLITVSLSAPCWSFCCLNTEVSVNDPEDEEYYLTLSGNQLELNSEL